MALRVESDEFLKLTKDAVRLLAVESSNFQIVGSLVNLPASGEAIIVGDIHGDLESLAHILKSSNFVVKASEGEDLLLVFLGLSQ